MCDDNIVCPSCGMEHLEEEESTYCDSPECPECGFDLTEYFDSYGE